MSRRVSLEDFDGTAPRPAPRAPAPQPPDIDEDALRSAGFEDGYKSGWDDCRAEHQKSELAVSSDLAQSLRDVEVTYHDARRDVLTAIKPVIDTIIAQVLPKIASEGLGAMVAQEIMPHLDAASELEAELHCAPDVVPVLQRLLNDREDLPVHIRPVPSFSGAQVALRMGAEARNIELSAAIDQISHELSSFTERLMADLPPNQKG